MKYFLFFLLFLAPLLAEKLEIPEIEAKVEQQLLIERENSFPITTPPKIAPRVDPITGTYSEDVTDMIVSGAEPLALRRFYTPTNCGPREFGKWLCNPEHVLIANLSDTRVAHLVSAGHRDGSFVCLQQMTENKCLFDAKQQKGYVSFSPTGQRHPFNAQLTYSLGPKTKRGKRFIHAGTLTEGDGTVRRFDSPRFNWLDPESSPSLPCKFQIREERKPNGNLVSYHYKRDLSSPELIRLLSKIVVYNSNKSKILNSLTFSY